MEAGVGNGEEFDTTALLAAPVNVVVLGTERSCKHRFLATFVGRQLALNPVDVHMKRLMWLDGAAFMINLDTNICGCWGINDQSFRSGQGFIFVYNTASRTSFEEFTVFRERIMRVKEVERRLPLMIVGYHKNDKLRQVATSEGKKLSEYFGCLFKEVRQDDPAGVEECVLDMLREVRAYESGYVAKKASGTDDQEAVDDVSGLAEFGIAVMGDIFVGKTCLVRKLISNSFHPRYISTSEDNTQKYRLAVDNNKFILRLIDTPGLMALDSLTKEYLLPMQGFILVYSVTSRDSFNRLQEYKKVIYKHKTETKIPIVIVGNKSDDKFGRQVSFEEGKLVARQLGASFFELSAKNDGVDAPFAQCVRDLQGLYEASPIMTENLGEMEKMGVLQQQQKKKLRSRTFTLRNGVLSFSNAGGAIKGSMVLTQGLSTEVGPHDPRIGYPFDILCGADHWMLVAPTAEERTAWLSAIRLNVAVKEVGDSLINEVLKIMLWEVVGLSGVKHVKRGDEAVMYRSEEVELLRRPTLHVAEAGAIAINNRSLDSLEAVDVHNKSTYGRSLGSVRSVPDASGGILSASAGQEKWGFSLRRGLSSLRRKDDSFDSSPRESVDEGKAERKAQKKSEMKEKKEEKKKEKEEKKKEKKTASLRP